jgi:hypothetical protein
MRSYFFKQLSIRNLSKYNWKKTRIQYRKKLLRTNVVLYGKLRFCERGISSGNLEVGKKATSFSLNQT